LATDDITQAEVWPVRIDRKQFKWLIMTLVLSAVSICVYLWDAPKHVGGPSGSTLVGLTLGITAFVMMLLLAGLSLRRKVPHWRIGRAQTWLRMHIWFGLLVCLLVALHSAFKVGGTMTLWLWILLAAVTVTGIYGLALQQLIPALLQTRVGGETIAQQLEQELESLDLLAQDVVVQYAGSVEQPAPPWTEEDSQAQPPAGGEPLRQFHNLRLMPFLAGERVEELAGHSRVAMSYEALRTNTPAHIHPGVDALQRLTIRRVDLLRQRRYMWLLFSWLIVHIPLAWLLIVLTAWHGIVAFRWGF
jgi:hypothetical protein